MKGGGEGKKGKGRGGKRMEGEEEGNGWPTYKGREVKGEEEKKGEGGSPGYYGFPPDLGVLE